MQRTVLVCNGCIFENTFGTYRDAYLWNMAWCQERFHRKTIGPEGRTWYGTVTPKGIEQVKKLGWSIESAYVALGEKK